MSRPLLGADFLRSKSLLVDFKRKWLMDAETYHSVPLRTTRTTAPHLNVSSISSNPYELLLAEFLTITTPVFTPSSIKHKVEHLIPTNGPPVHTHARRLSPDKLAVGAVLQQHINNSGEPLAFFSKKLHCSETKYSSFDRELLALMATTD